MLTVIINTLLHARIGLHFRSGLLESRQLSRGPFGTQQSRVLGYVDPKAPRAVELRHQANLQNARTGVKEKLATLTCKAGFQTLKSVGNPVADPRLNCSLRLCESPA